MPKSFKDKLHNIESEALKKLADEDERKKAQEIIDREKLAIWNEEALKYANRVEMELTPILNIINIEYLKGTGEITGPSPQKAQKRSDTDTKYSVSISLTWDRSNTGSWGSQHKITIYVHDKGFYLSVVPGSNYKYSSKFAHPKYGGRNFALCLNSRRWKRSLEDIIVTCLANKLTYETWDNEPIY